VREGRVEHWRREEQEGIVRDNEGEYIGIYGGKYQVVLR